MQLRTIIRGGLSAVVLFTIATAQTPDPQHSPANTAAASTGTEMSTHDAPATFSTKVNLVTVPVVVRDSRGKAIGNLKQEDFQLFDRGKQQTITRFQVEKVGEHIAPPVVATKGDAAETAEPGTSPAVAPIAEHFVAYLFDDVHTANSDLMAARNAADRHIDATLDARSRAAIFTTSGQGNLDFTDDRIALHNALARLMSRPMSTAGLCPDISYYVADLIVNKGDINALQTAGAMALNTCLQIPAKTQQDLQQAAKEAETISRNTAMQIITVNDRDSRLAMLTLRDAVRRLAVAPGDRTLVMVSGGFFLSDDRRSDEMDIMDSAIRANVRISALNARGLYTPSIADASLGTRALPPAVMGQLQQFERADEAQAEEILQELTDATAGRYFHNNNDLAAGFAQLTAPPEFVYMLGFSPQNLKTDGKFHALKVRLANGHGLDVQARRGYFAPRHADDPQEDAKREIQEAMFSRDEMQDMPLDLHMQFFKTSESTANVTVLAKVGIRALQFRKADGRNNDNLTFSSGLFDRNGNFVTGKQRVLEMRLLDTTLEKLQATGITVRTNFDVPPGSYVVRLVVRDSEGRAISARNGVVEIP